MIGLTASVLLVLSLGVHFITFWNVNLQERFPSVLFLHLGIFVLIVPFLLLIKWEEKQEKDSNKKMVFPNWLIAIYFILCLYTVINLAIFGFADKQNPMIVNGKYVLKNKERVVREVSKEEYDIASAQSLRGLSGHWIISYFFFASIAFLKSSKTKDEENVSIT